MSVLLVLTILLLLAGFALLGVMFHRRDEFLGLVGLGVLTCAGVLGTVHGAMAS